MNRNRLAIREPVAFSLRKRCSGGVLGEVHGLEPVHLSESFPHNRGGPHLEDPGTGLRHRDTGQALDVPVLVVVFQAMVGIVR